MTTVPPTASSGILTRARSEVAATRQRAGGEEWMFSIREEVAELLEGSPFTVDSYLQAAYREVMKSPQLVQAAKDAGPTLLGAVMLGATLQLPIGGPLGQFYLTPRPFKQGDGWGQSCVPMIGYRGFFELGYRSGIVRSFDYLIVREGDTFRQGANSERGSFFDWEQAYDGEHGENDPDGKVRPLRGVVAIAHLSNGDRPAFHYLSRTEIERRRPKRTQNTPWEGPHADAMYVKTAHRELAKYLPLSISVARAVESDEQVNRFDKATGALETVPDGAIVLDVEEPADGIDADQGEEQAPAAEQGSPRVSASSEDPEPADRRTAPPTDEVHPRDLPALAAAEGRELTEIEYERFSAWEAGQA